MESTTLGAIFELYLMIELQNIATKDCNLSSVHLNKYDHLFQTASETFFMFRSWLKNSSEIMFNSSEIMFKYCYLKSMVKNIAKVL